MGSFIGSFATKIVNPVRPGREQRQQLARVQRSAGRATHQILQRSDCSALMSHQVLARKWRPRSFQEMVGQSAVVKALTNSLVQNRLHHAYLFTGTRGVGKTSLARLFSKCLNCERGVTATPCNQCINCQAVDQGRFLDLLEIDAASRTKVEDTRDLLDNVQYAPTQGRYKIYLIDEVHMLSNHSFNALLKTLEEPPLHVKFILATTDPQRLPITVLSRCLQFHLKPLSPEHISQQLSHILTQEQIAYELPAIQHIAQVAQGSLRDALSVLDQAIAHGNGQVVAAEVNHLLGTATPELILNLLVALVDADAQQLLEIINQLAECALDFVSVLGDFLSLLHQIIICQAVANASTPTSLATTPLSMPIQQLAKRLHPAQLHAYYQMGLIGRRDLHLAPTLRTGFEMVLLRMLTCSPNFIAPTPSQPEKKPPAPVIKTTPTTIPTPSVQSTQPATLENSAPVNQPALEADAWGSLLPLLNLQGSTLVIASHCALAKQTTEEIHLQLDTQYASLLNTSIQERLTAALQQHFKQPIRLQIEITAPTAATPAILEKHRQDKNQADAVATIMADDTIHSLLNEFNAQIVNNSIKGLNTPALHTLANRAEDKKSNK